MNKRDRQGVRTPANLEQKYDFGEFQKKQEQFNKSLGGKVERQESSINAFKKQVEDWFESVTKSIEKLWKSIDVISKKQTTNGVALSSLADSVESLIKWKKEVESEEPEPDDEPVPSELLVKAYANDFSFNGVTVDKTFDEIETAIQSDINVRVKARNNNGQYAFLYLASYIKGKAIEFIGWFDGVQIALRQWKAFLKGAFGSVITLSDATSDRLHGLVIYGKTTQNGTPTPDAPVPLVSPGDGGSLGVMAEGKNLLNVDFAEKTDRGVTFSPVGDGGVMLTGAVTSGYPFLSVGRVYLTAGVWYYPTLTGNVLENMGLRLINRTVDPAVNAISKAAAFSATVSGWYEFEITTNPGFDGTTTIYPMVEIGKSATEYEAYKGQSASFSTPNGLPGIRVDTGGNNVDTSGQQWLCDVVDLGTGDHVQNVGEWVFNGDENWKYSAPYFYLYGLNEIVPTSGANDYPPLMCDHYETKTANQVSSTASAYNQIGITHRASEVRINNHTADLSAFTAQLKASPIRVLYQLATPIRTPLSAEDLAAYAALHTYSPNTTIYNDGGAEMDVKYMAFYN